LLAHLNTLYLSDNRLRHLRPLFETPAVGCLTRLVMSRNLLTGEGIAPLTESPHLGRLTELEMTSNRLDDEAAARLASAECRRDLRVLRLRHNRFSAVGREVLRQAFGERVQL
jgi:Ran GTPase-activating protein (RanGAP) involved in mRNA processing and transport